MGEERGWFPSNYVATISDQEAEAALSSSTYDAPQSTLPDDSMVDMGDNMSRALSESDRDGDWLERDEEFSAPSHRTDGHSSTGSGTVTQHHDFWVPQVGSDGRVRIMSHNRLSWIAEPRMIADILCQYPDRCTLARASPGSRGRRRLARHQTVWLACRSQRICSGCRWLRCSTTSGHTRAMDTTSS